jgi:hypothetical protein
MANRTLTSDIIAAEALMLLENNLVMSNLVYRAEDEFTTVNGYRVGDTVNIRKPAQFEVREGATATPQDVIEGKMPLVVDTQAGVDFQFMSKDLTLNIKDLSQRVMKPAMIRLGNYLDSKLMDLYKQVPNWVGTPGQTINSFSDFAVATQRMDDLAIPMDDRQPCLLRQTFGACWDHRPRCTSTRLLKGLTAKVRSAGSVVWTRTWRRTSAHTLWARMSAAP